MIEKMNNVFNGVETVLHVANGVPFICLISSSVQVNLGVLQKVMGLAMAVIGAIGYSLNRRNRDEWVTLLRLGNEHVIQGALNIIDGIGQALMGLYTFGLGNLICLTARYVYRGNFDSFVKYGFISEDKISRRVFL
jgi:hypothetical protein